MDVAPCTSSFNNLLHLMYEVFLIWVRSDWIVGWLKTLSLFLQLGHVLFLEFQLWHLSHIITYPFCRFAHRQPQGCLQEVPRFGWSIAHLVTKNMFGVCAWLLRFEAMVAAHSTGYVYYVSAPRKGKRNYSQRNLWVKLGVFSGTC